MSDPPALGSIGLDWVARPLARHSPQSQKREVMRSYRVLLQALWVHVGGPTVQGSDSVYCYRANIPRVGLTAAPNAKWNEGHCKQPE